MGTYNFGSDYLTANGREYTRMTDEKLCGYAKKLKGDIAGANADFNKAAELRSQQSSR
jgi:hypothetical protein